MENDPKAKPTNMDVSLAVSHVSRAAAIGSNGAGKSTGHSGSTFETLEDLVEKTQDQLEVARKQSLEDGIGVATKDKSTIMGETC